LLPPLSLTHLNIPSPDPAALRTWYAEALGLQEHAGMLYGGRSVFNVVRGESLPAGTFHFGFRLDTKAGVQAWAEHLVARSVAVEGAYADHGDYATAYFRDPDGNVFELFWETDAPG